MPFKYASLQERLLANSEAVPNPNFKEPCRFWTGRVNSSGYGKINIRLKNRKDQHGHRKMKNYLAHRVSKALALGVPVWRLNVCMHLCDNRTCIEPTHIHSSTQKANMRDCVKKGRHANAYGPTCRASA